VFRSQLLLLDPERAQPLGARTLHELEIVRVIHDAAGIGVFPIDAYGDGEG